MSWRLRWLVIAPVLLFVVLTLAMSSCGGGGGCEGSFDEFGDFVAGQCPTPGPHIGFSIDKIVIGFGTPIPPTPTPSPTPTGGAHHAPTPTATPTLVPQAMPTAVSVGNTIPFNASAEFVLRKRKMVADITNRGSTLWTSSDTNVLRPPGPPPNGGIYTALNSGCVCIDASSGGISADPISVSVFNPPAMPMPCPICPTIIPTATATPRGHKAPEADSAAPSANIAGTLQWDFETASAIVSDLVPSSDGSLYFLTADGDLHNLGANGREHWRRHAAGKSLAVSPDGVVYALSADGKLVAQLATGRPLWRIDGGGGFGPLAASSSAVYFRQDGQLVAASASSGDIQWRVSAPDGLTSATIAADSTVIVGASGGEVAAMGSDGAARWSFTPQGGFDGAIAVRGGIVYVGSRSGRLYALDTSNGAIQWSYDATAAIASGPALSPLGPVFFGADAIYALNPDGSLAWRKPVTTPVSAPMASDGAGGVFAALEDVGAMFNTDGTLKWTSRSFGTIEHVAISPSGILYVASQGTIYAVK